MKLAVNRCPIHLDFWSVSIDGNGGGTRITPSKCCGQWQVEHEWTLNARGWEKAADLCLVAAEETAKEKADER